MRVSCLLFCLLMRLFSFYKFVSSSLDIIVCAWSYRSIFCPVSMMSLGGLLFSKGRFWEDRSGGEGRQEVRDGGNGEGKEGGKLYLGCNI